MGEILEAEGGTPEVRQMPVHCIGGPVTVLSWPQIARMPLYCLAVAPDLEQLGGDAAADHVLHHLFRLGLVGIAVNCGDGLSDAPDRFDLGVLLESEHRVEPALLLVGVQAGAGMQGVVCLAESGTGAPTMTEGLLLNALSVWSSASPVRRKTWKGPNSRDRVGEFFGSGGLVKPVDQFIATASMHFDKP